MQTPAPFDYARASSLEPRMAYVDWLVDVNDLRDLDYVRVSTVTPSPSVR